MDIFIDGQNTVFSADELCTLGDVFQFVDETIAGQSRCVTGVTIDGQAIVTGDVGEMTLRPTDSIERAEFVTASSTDLVESLVGELATQIDELGDVVREIAGKFQETESEPPLDTLPQMIEAWQGVIQRLMTSANLLRLDLDSLDLGDGDTAGQHHAKLSDTLEKLSFAVEVKDYVLVADLLEYEIAPGIERETVVLDALRQAVLPSDTG